MKKVFFLALIALALGGCNTMHVMKDCKPMGEEFPEYSVCKNQWKIWGSR